MINGRILIVIFMDISSRICGHSTRMYGYNFDLIDSVHANNREERLEDIDISPQVIACMKLIWFLYRW